MIIRENRDCFARASALRPVDRVQTEIVAQLRVGARIHQQLDEIGMAEDDGEDEGRLAATRSFIHVRAIGQ